MVQRLTLEKHGEGDCAFYTVGEFWDCECDQSYIHLRAKSIICPDCMPDVTIDEAEEFPGPDSRLIEVLEKFPELQDVPWVMWNGESVNKDEVRAQMTLYIQTIKA